MTDETVTYEVADHIATITLNRPAQRNALNWDAYAKLEKYLRQAVTDSDARCVIVTGADPAFCSGDDVREIMAGPKAVSADTTPVVRHKPTPAAMAALECDKPLIAAVNGAAIGWGMELALYADIRIASEQAKFSEMFIKRGLVCDVGGFYRLPSIVGPAKALKLVEHSQWDRPLLQELSAAMADASICGLGQAAPNPVLSVLKYFPHEVAQ